MPDDVPTLTDEDQTALQGWVRAAGLGSQVTSVEPLTGGSQNIVVRLRIDDRPMCCAARPNTRVRRVTRRCSARSRS
jgi:hypothetical protein